MASLKERVLPSFIKDEVALIDESQLRDLDVSCNDHNLIDILSEGLTYPTRVQYGLNAHDEDCYTTYRAIYSKAIRDYHKLNDSELPPLTQTPIVHSSNCTSTEDRGEASHEQSRSLHQIVMDILKESPTKGGKTRVSQMNSFPTRVSVRCRFARNIRLNTNRGEKVRFCPRMDTEEREGVESVLVEALQRASLAIYGSRGKYFRLEDMKKNKAWTLLLRRFGFADPSETMQAAGLSRCWPHNRGVWPSPGGKPFAWINEEDHLRLGCIEENNTLESSLHQTQALERALVTEGKVQFCWDEEFGFLTTCLTNVHTGLRASAQVQLPHYFS